ncbi:MAG TPA: helix-turn-helix transcriptional regulator [Thermoanaerobaculia bacterium]|nr:helix-turn-helix transcriptional regulator [Thermoanaerobaculia bacterium]
MSVPDRPLTPAQLHVLLALADGPRHGYAIMKAAAESAGLSMGPGTVYGTLARLEGTGWVVELPGAAGRRRNFQLLPPGRSALEREAARLASLAELLRSKRLLGAGSAR